MNNQVKSSLANDTQAAKEYEYKLDHNWKFAIQLKKDITRVQKIKTLTAVDRSILNYLASSNPMIYNVRISSEINDLKNKHLAIVSAASTLGYAATQLVPPPPPGGGPHKEIFTGIPKLLQGNIISLKSI